MNRIAIILMVLLSFPPFYARAEKAPEEWAEMAISELDVHLFDDAADSLSILLELRTGVREKVGFRKIVARNTTLDFYFTPTIGYYPWRSSHDFEWLSSNLKALMPPEYSAFAVGSLFCDRISMQMLLTPGLGKDGKALTYRWVQKAPKGHAVVRSEGAREFPKGLSGRNLAVWQSHGRYFNAQQDRWMWQRPPMHTTLEDVFTQDFVLPYLIPMFERAGAYVMTPRERDVQRMEYIIDNDPSFAGAREGELRRSGAFRTEGQWMDAGLGFADTAAVYRLFENPFHAGTALKARCRKGTCRAIWTPDIGKRDNYAVYVSYTSLPESTPAAKYTVRHMGGESTFLVDQRMAGGTWVYLGTFEFDEGCDGCVILDNSVPSSSTVPSGAVVTADAVKIGGGMGKVGRGENLMTSGLPSHLEGALYWEQWAGADSTVIGQWDNDYTCDYASRGAWVKMMKEERGVPFDLSLAVHTDAGVTPCDSIIGTLAIYTYRSENKTAFPDGRSRIISRALADMVQSQICSDIRSQYDPLWNRRGMWDKEYSESRRSDTPALLIEMLSHQNFSDMRLALDPSFRFTISRSIYKGVLKYLSTLYGIPYAVAPLPIRDFAVSTDSLSAVLSWKDVTDTLEPTAIATDHILYTRIDDGAFDNGQYVSNGCRIPILKDHLYSFKVEAVGEGGRSFPSEVLCCGVPESSADPVRLLVVNNFNRVAGPSWIDTPDYAGFFGDEGMGQYRTLSYAGPVYELRRNSKWTDDSNPGFGACDPAGAGIIRNGNTLDFTKIHASAALKAGYAVSSCSRDAFVKGSCFASGSADTLSRPDVIDLMCGGQVTTTIGRGVVEPRFSVFPAGLRKALGKAADNGVMLLVSGAYVGTDITDDVYPVASDNALDSTALQSRLSELASYRAASTEFANQYLGYRFLSSRGSALYSSDSLYPVPNPDSITPSSKKASIYSKYSDTGLPSAVFFEGENWKSLTFAFPLELRPELISEAIQDLLAVSK